MIRYFKKLDSNEIVDLLDYCVEKIAENKNVKIYIGTDSQNKKEHTVYTTAVVFRNEQRGAHFIYKKIRVPKIKDLFSRLYKECELSLEVVEWVKSNSALSIEAVELDYNNAKITKSTNLVAATRGWVESLGYTAKVKPEVLIAIKAADWICRN